MLAKCEGLWGTHLKFHLSHMFNVNVDYSSPSEAYFFPLEQYLWTLLQWSMLLLNLFPITSHFIPLTRWAEGMKNKCHNTNPSLHNQQPVMVCRRTTKSFSKTMYRSVVRGIFKELPHFSFYNFILLMIMKTKYIIFLHTHPAFQHIFPSIPPTS
jgi:hypothetical protein